MRYMFYAAHAFNQPIMAWDVSNVDYNESIFSDCPISNVNKPKRVQTTRVINTSKPQGLDKPVITINRPLATANKSVATSNKPVATSNKPVATGNRSTTTSKPASNGCVLCGGAKKTRRATRKRSRKGRRTQKRGARRTRRR